MNVDVFTFVPALLLRRSASPTRLFVCVFVCLFVCLLVSVSPREASSLCLWDCGVLRHLRQVSSSCRPAEKEEQTPLGELAWDVDQGLIAQLKEQYRKERKGKKGVKSKSSSSSLSRLRSLTPQVPTNAHLGGS